MAKMKIGVLFVAIVLFLLLAYTVIIMMVVSTSFAAKKATSRISELELSLEQKDQVIEELKQKITDNEMSQQEANKLFQSTRFTNPEAAAYRPGVIVLGMHRSGTSVVGGLLTKMGLNVGDPRSLIGAAEDNTKGFFERTDVVLMNDWLFRKQNLHYSSGTSHYIPIQGLKDILNDKGETFWGTVTTEEGRKALTFFNDPANEPWMMKDPRLCITLRTWLPQLRALPAVLFTYRHPMDVALSMHKRETEQFPLPRALRLWYVYNRRAVRQSGDLCRVVSSHSKVMHDPRGELNKIHDALLQCGVVVPRRVTEEDSAAFVEPGLQHGRTAIEDAAICEGGAVSIAHAVPHAKVWDTQEEGHLSLYRECMRAYCAMENGSAFSPEFRWDYSIQD